MGLFVFYHFAIESQACIRIVSVPHLLIHSCSPYYAPNIIMHRLERRKINYCVQSNIINTKFCTKITSKCHIICHFLSLGQTFSTSHLFTNMIPTPSYLKVKMLSSISVGMSVWIFLFLQNVSVSVIQRTGRHLTFVCYFFLSFSLPLLSSFLDDGCSPRSISSSMS